MGGSIDATIDGLRALLGDRCSTSASVRAIHGRDESVFEAHLPDAVVLPTSTDEVAAIVRVCAQHASPIVPFGAGSGLEGHAIPIEGGISVDLSLMNRILEVSVDDLDVRVQAGVRRVELNEAIGWHGLFFSVDPGADASLGGMAATNASGTTTVRYGAMKENVLACEVVLPDGRVIRTGTRARKSAAGYDLTRLFIGSEGTLGILTELTLRVHGIPDHIAAASCSFPEVRAAVDTAIAIVQLGIPIARCELLDAAAMRAVNGYAGLSEPEEPTLFFEFHGTQASVAEDAQAAGAIAAEHGGSGFRWATRTEERSRLWRARHDVLFAARAQRPGCKVVPTDACVPISRLAECITASADELDALPFPTLIVGHVADGNFHAALMIDPSDPRERDLALGFTKELSARARLLGGTCTGEHGIGIGKREALVEERGAAVDVMRALKAALDPTGIMNPGKVFTDRSRETS